MTVLRYCELFANGFLGKMGLIDDLGLMGAEIRKFSSEQKIIISTLFKFSSEIKKFSSELFAPIPWANFCIPKNPENIE